MTRSSAAQEPSMDEILASIRRIIESGDERTDSPLPAVASRTKPERSVVVERLGLEDGANVVARLSPDIDTAFLPGDEDDLEAHLRREIEADALMQSPAAQEAETEPRDETSRADRASEDATPSPSGSPSRSALVDLPETSAHERAQSQDAVDRSDVSGPAEVDAAPTPLKAEDEPERAADAPFIAANSDSRRMQGFRAAVLDDLVEGGQLESGAALVSGRTGELVGASFDELARAIREGELRSLEDMAQELLRPMLQDWLDDNLPKLVERLVREEIERVARGGRR